MADGEKSVTWIVVAAAIFVAYLGWGFMAGSYTGAHTPSISDMTDEELDDLKAARTRRSGRNPIGAFVMNSIGQLPNLPAVISWHFSNRIWLPILVMLALAGVIGGGFALKRLEQNLNQPRYRR